MLVSRAMIGYGKRILILPKHEKSLAQFTRGISGMKWSACLLALLSILGSTASAQLKLELNRGDHICIVGGTVAERMQHYGYLETLLHARFPQHELVFRNLAFSGDEISGFRDDTKRLRSRDFGSHDQWLSGNAPCPQVTKLSSRDQGKVQENRFELTNTKADVIFAFYGYNESFAGEAGLPAFRQSVDAFIKHTLSQNYNGKSAPKLVLFSPIAHEYLDDPNLLSRAQIDQSNARIKRYADAMGEIAKANSVLFIDLFATTLNAYQTKSTAAAAVASTSNTFNGIHQNSAGDLLIATLCNAGLFTAASPKSEGLEPLRKAVNDKNFYWYHRYRVTDGYSTYGDRAFLKFAEGPGGYGDGLSNYSVGQRN